MTDLPHSRETEQAVIGRLLIDPSKISSISGALRPEYFHVPDYREAYEAMLELTSRNKAVDVVTLGKDQQVLFDAITSVGQGYSAPLEEYAAIIKDNAFRRQVVLMAARISRQAGGDTSSDDLLVGMSNEVARLSAESDTGKLLSPQQAVAEYRKSLEARATGEPGLTYGLPALDKLVQPAKGGDMIVIAARPSVGKSALAIQIADHWARVQSKPILFASLEMSVNQLMDREVSRLGNIDASKVTRGEFGIEEAAAAERALDYRSGTGIWYLDDPHGTTATLRGAAAKVRMMAGGLGGIVVDYLQILKDETKESEVQRVTRISRNLKAIAREYDVPIVCLSQLNRSVELREDKHPKLYDLRESGAIEQDADLVIGIYRDLGTEAVDVDVLKNRQGRVGRVNLRFDLERVTFSG